MSDAERQRRARKRKRERGMVDIRVDISTTLRDRLKQTAQAENKTMKEVIREQLEKITINQFF